MKMVHGDLEKTPSEIAKGCFWIFMIDAYSKGKRVEIILSRLKRFIDEHPKGRKYSSKLESNFFDTLSKSEKSKGLLIQRVSQIHQFLFFIIENEAQEPST